MTSGEPLYLVSACGSAEEFVAAFRRYADRTGLFIPAASPLPAGRRGYLAVTLKDGGVMIQGEAEILQSSAKPTVLHGRPGMTVKFIEPDELSKIVIGELEKARLAMKVPTPSVLPRPATIPAEPRPVVPPIAGRIDAANALAECVVIGDPATLIDTANAPRGTHDPASAGNKAKFVVPSIPSELGGRPKTPSVPPAISAPPSRPKTPSVPPSISPPQSRPKTPSVPPSIPAAPPRTKTPSIPPSIRATGASESSGPKPAPVVAKSESSGPKSAARPTPSGPTSIAAPIAAPPSEPKPAPVPPEPDASKPAPRPPPSSMPAPDGHSSMPAQKMTSIGFPAIDKFPANIDLLQTQHGVSGAALRTPAAVKPASDVETDEEATTIGEAPPKKITDPMPTTAPQKTTELAAASPHAKSHKATSIGFPAMRSPFETQPVGVVPPPMAAKAGDPAPPFVAKSKSGVPGPRGKNPTTPPLTPRHPTPVAPLPIVRPPARSALPAAEEEEKTDLGGVPQAADPHASTVESGRAYNDGVDPHEKTATAPHGRSGGMRASEIMAAIPTEDWTMTPEASQPTVVPSMSQPRPVVASEPAPAPKGPPTGDWTIQLDPEAGWSPPAKVETPAPADETKPAKRAKTPAAGAQAAKSGNPDVAVSSKEAFTAVEWEDKPTGIGEAKIEIDSTLMEPLTPMPALEDEDPAALMQPLGKMPSATGSQSAYSTGPQQATGYATGPHLAAPTRPEVIPPPLAPMPPVGSSSGFSAAALMTPHAMPAAHGPDSFGGYGQMPFPQQPAHNVGAAVALPSKKKQIIVMASVAVAAVLAVVLVMLLTGHKANKPAAGTGSGSALVDKPVVMQANGSAAVRANDHVAVGSGSADEAIGSGSAQQAIAPAVVDAGAPTQETPSGTCQVQVDSVPAGADVFLDKTKLGATPDKFDLPCGVESTLTLRKAKFLATARAVKPVADKPNKVLIKLGKMTFSLKVTSTPAGATITAGGKNAGVTPATIKISGFEATTITLSKPGYAVDSEKVTAKANGQAHHVVLKKGGRH